MKKLFYLASIAALAFSSCTKDDTTGVELPATSNGLTITASRGADTRSFLGQDANGNLVVMWSAGDAFSAYGDAARSVANVKFSLDPNDHGKTQGKFQSEGDNHLLLDGDNVVFFYPHNSLYKMTPTWTGDALDVESVTDLEIKAEQQYQIHGTFASTMAPSIGFLDLDTIDAADLGNGRHEADVTMETLTDMVAVNIQGTEPIHSVSLRLENKTGVGDPLYVINGVQMLNDYLIGSETHYYLANLDEDNNPATVGFDDELGTTTIKVGRQDAIACHEPRTYVFNVPAGILGMNNGVTATIMINKDDTDFDATSAGEDKYWFRLDGDKLNGTAEFSRAWKDGVVNSESVGAMTEMSNVVFWLNDKNADGSRSSILFNPNNDFIIRNELDWLIYFNEYANSAMANETDSAYGRDAYVCGPEEYTPGVVNFNFAPANIGKIATELISEDRVYPHNDKNYKANAARYTKYVDDYGINGMPCIDNYDGVAAGEDTNVVYNSEFKGHDATLLNVGKLQSANGIFGKLGENANISDINFEGAVNEGAVILSNDTTEGVISEIGVKNAQADAVIGETTKVADYEALDLEGVTGLNYIINDMTLNEDLDVENWDVVYNVQKSVFEWLDTEEGEHNTATTPSVIETYADDYAKLAEDVAIYRVEGNDTAVSVILSDRSMWTGSWANTAELVSGVYALENAEQLAYSYGERADAALTIDVDANYDNIEISWPNEVEYNTLNGGENTIYGLTMVTYDKGRGVKSEDDYYLDFKTKYIADYNGKVNGYNALYHFGTDALAPFKFNKVSDLTIEGLSITIDTSNESNNFQRVPANIAGLSKSVVEVTNVNITGMKVNAYEVSETLNGDAYYDGIVPRVGWFASSASEIRVKDSSAEVTEYNVLGLAALVSEVEVINIDANFTNCSVTDPATLPAIENFDEFDPTKKNYMLGGTMVALVVNKNNNSYGIEFNQSGAPKFLYHFSDNAGTASGIAVYYNNLQEYSITPAGVIEK